MCRLSDIFKAPVEPRAPPTNKVEVLRLYRHILKSHHSFPPEFRAVGNIFVREEWKKHMTASPKYVTPFLEQWTEYLQQVENHRRETELNSIYHEIQQGQQEDNIANFMKGYTDTPPSQFSADQIQQLNKFKKELEADDEPLDHSMDFLTKEK